MIITRKQENGSSVVEADLRSELPQEVWHGLTVSIGRNSDVSKARLTDDGRLIVTPMLSGLNTAQQKVRIAKVVTFVDSMILHRKNSQPSKSRHLTVR